MRPSLKHSVECLRESPLFYYNFLKGMPMLVNQKAIKDFCKKRDRRVSPTFLHAIDRWLVVKLKQACRAHNGGKITLDADVAGYVGINFDEREDHD